MYDYIEINTDNVSKPTEANSICDSREGAAKSFANNSGNELSIAVITYNRLDKTKVCVEHLIRNTEVPYHLFLIDSGSGPEVLEYYKAVKHPQKTIIRITNNINANYSFWVAMQHLNSRYCAIISNDVVVTKNAIANLLTCIKSANNIGWVSPVCSNISNRQQVLLPFHSIEEMNDVATSYNISNPLKWEERLMLMPAIFFYKKECIDIVGGFDYGFFHDFADDDMARRMNRAGYKTILCKDTWVHHDHIYHSTPQDTAKLNASLTMGRKNFAEKYFGLDAWDDFRNYEMEVTSLIEKPNKTTWVPSILGIDTRCGTPILDVRNKLREFGITQTASYAFTTKAKYFLDLQTICEKVTCDRIDFLYDYYEKNSFDYMILGEPINTYDKPFHLLEKLFSLIKDNGTFLFKLRNTSNQNNLMYSLGNIEKCSLEESALCISFESIHEYIQEMGAKLHQILVMQEPLYPDAAKILDVVSENVISPSFKEIALPRLITKDYLFCIRK